MPTFAQQNIETTIAVDKAFVRGSGKLFALKVQGDSMVKAGIYPGNLTIVRQQSTAQNGEIVVALFNEEATVKRCFLKNGLIILQPENDTMQPIIVSDKEGLRVLGKVVATLRRI